MGSGPRGPPISPVRGFLSSGKRSKSSFSTAGFTSSTGVSQGASSFPVGVLPFFRFTFLVSSEYDLNIPIDAGVCGFHSKVGLCPNPKKKRLKKDKDRLYLTMHSHLF